MQEDHSQGLRQARSVARLVEAPWYPVVPGESECVFVKTKQKMLCKVKTEQLLNLLLPVYLLPLLLCKGIIQMFLPRLPLGFGLGT